MDWTPKINRSQGIKSTLEYFKTFSKDQLTKIEHKEFKKFLKNKYCTKKTGRYSYLIRPIIAFLDILIINMLGIYMLNFKYYETYYFHFYITIFWIALAYMYKYYDVYRFTQPLKIFSLTAKQVLSFTFAIFAFWGLFKINYVGKTATCLLAIYVFIVIASKKLFYLFCIKKISIFFWR